MHDTGQERTPWSTVATTAGNSTSSGHRDEKPNIVFILTDDQDAHLNSLAYMPKLQKHLIDQGTLFERHYVTVALCCPSRVSLWTGRAAHNTNVTDVQVPYGGYPKFVSQGFNEAWLPLWLQEAGYNTYYTGKLFNAHTVANYHSPFVSGFNGSDFLLDPYTYDYLNATFQRDHDVPVSHEGEYSTDVIIEKARGLIDDGLAASAAGAAGAGASGRPFFVTIAPIAPHSNVQGTLAPGTNTTAIRTNRTTAAAAEDYIPGQFTMTAPIPAERHAHLFPDAIVPRTPHFNPDTPSGVSWVSRLPQQTEDNVAANDHFYRQRLRALQAVDELVEAVVEQLAAAGQLDNTYIFYSSDNGFHIGQHRLQPGKECGFEEDINVPLIVRGPGVAHGHAVRHTVTTHTDLAPTFLGLAGGGSRDDFDGLAIDYWGYGYIEGQYDAGRILNNTYKALRLVGDDYDLYYSVWCSGEHELYDLSNDRYQLNNLYPAPNQPPPLFSFASNTTRPRPVSQVIARLDSLLLVLKSCKASSCTDPWRVLHPGGSVSDLHAALAPQFDHFYDTEQERVSFSRCELGYIISAEGPQDVKPFGGAADQFPAHLFPRGGKDWAELV
ncbi:hypothetical protein DV735_g4905, partial [Chaetothyriales sp. CBS 134920]